MSVAATVDFCLGCGTSLPKGMYQYFLCGDAARGVEGVYGHRSERNSVVIDEDAVMSSTTGFICRKCV